MKQKASYNALKQHTPMNNVSSNIHTNRASCVRSPPNLSEHLLVAIPLECKGALVHSSAQKVHSSKFNSAVVKWIKLNF